MAKKTKPPVVLALSVIIIILLLAVLVLLVGLGPIQRAFNTTHTKHVVTVIKSGSVFELGSIEANVPSVLMEQLQMPAGMPVNATVSGAYNSTANVVVVLAGPMSLGEWFGLFGTNQSNFSASEDYLMSGAMTENTAGPTFNISIRNTTLTPTFRNFTCFSYDLGNCTAGFAYPHYEYWLIFANYHKDLNVTLRITQPLNVTYYT